MTNSTDFIWGCKAIAFYIGRSPRATFHLLESRKLPAGKVGATWVASKKVLSEYLDGVAGRGTIDEPS